MAVCKKCNKPLHPLSRFAQIGIGPECLRSSNPETEPFIKKMNIEISKEDRELADDINAAVDSERRIELNTEGDAAINRQKTIQRMYDLSKEAYPYVDHIEDGEMEKLFYEGQTLIDSSKGLLEIHDRFGGNKLKKFVSWNKGYCSEGIRKIGLKNFKKESAKKIKARDD